MSDDITVLTYNTPARAGTDRLSKLIFSDDFVKDIVTNTLFDIPGSNFRVANNEWQEGHGRIWSTSLCSRSLYQSLLWKFSIMKRIFKIRSGCKWSHGNISFCKRAQHSSHLVLYSRNRSQNQISSLHHENFFNHCIKIMYALADHIHESKT
ncbi:hypothetical protein K492DRAFT_208946 [Lichtheimia hyalospora FSU 10163]|nr:hypothetical protein K492DRAFT_208946 [Lichtheimia hyalospora FSU 10163]